jgi:uncharacterized glyoxalase superfamily protein PhnB
MNGLAANTVSTIVPSLRYRDALAAIDWLCRAFGFEQRVVHAEGDIVHHAQLTFGNGMLMLSSAQGGGSWDRYLAQPDETGGRETQCCCLAVADADAHHARAIAAGAEVFDPLSDREYGGRGYGCRDPEGHIWWFGTYDPWKD